MKYLLPLLLILSGCASVASEPKEVSAGVPDVYLVFGVQDCRIRTEYMMLPALIDPNMDDRQRQQLFQFHQAWQRTRLKNPVADASTALQYLKMDRIDITYLPMDDKKCSEVIDENWHYWKSKQGRSV
jgi:hypothetical protein